jgi:AP-3 complex subunit sigma
MKRDTRINNH